VQRTSSDSGFELESEREEKKRKEKREVSPGVEISAVIARGSEHL
jgi:hypothetical protein